MVICLCYERNAAEAWMSPMFGSWRQLVTLQCSVGSKQRLCMQQSAAVCCEPTFSTLKWCPKSGGRWRFITVWFRLIRKMPASVCPGSEEKGVANVGVEAAQCSVHLTFLENELQIYTCIILHQMLGIEWCSGGWLWCYLGLINGFMRSLSHVFCFLCNQTLDNKLNPERSIEDSFQVRHETLWDRVCSYCVAFPWCPTFQSFLSLVRSWTAVTQLGSDLAFALFSSVWARCLWQPENRVCISPIMPLPSSPTGGLGKEQGLAI